MARARKSGQRHTELLLAAAEPFNFGEHGSGTAANLADGIVRKSKQALKFG